jgi:anti-anti-sigma regulatory factor
VMQKQNTIKLNKIILYDRSQAQELGKAISKSDSSKIIIDFSGVDFISRAFADEWLNVLEKVKQKKTVIIRHIKQNPKKMIQVVRKKRREINKQLYD